MEEEVRAGQKLRAAAPASQLLTYEFSEAWRYTGPFTRRQRFKNLFPGFGIASAAFAVYLVYDFATAKADDHGGHSEEHGQQHH